MKGSSSGFGDLKKLQQAVARERAQARRNEIASARQDRQAIRVPAEDTRLFQRAMQAVTPLKTGRGANQVASPSCATQAPSAEQLAKRRSAAGELPAPPTPALSDQFSPRLHTDAGIAWFAPDMAADTPRRLQRGQWPIQARIDLHGMRTDAAREALLAFLTDCLAHRVRCARIIHGKGYGSVGAEPVLRQKTPAWLMQHGAVCAFAQVPPSEGGEGALIVLLRPAQRA